MDRQCGSWSFRAVAWPLRVDLISASVARGMQRRRDASTVLSPRTVRRAGELRPRAQVEIVPGAPHSMYWETPALFNEALAKFLAQVYAVG